MKRHEAGFSLMETLIGLTLTALIAASLIGGIRTGIRLWTASDRLDAAQEEARLMRLAADWMEQALPDALLNAEPGTLFSGTSDAVSFVVAGPAGPKDGGLSRLRIEAAVSQTCPGKRDLVLLWAEVAPAADYPSGEAVRRTLRPCLDAVEFNYFGTSASDPVLGWKREWTKGAALPAIISIRAGGSEGAVTLMARPYRATAARQYADDA